jgi:hypothetical protein
VAVAVAVGVAVAVAVGVTDGVAVGVVVGVAVGVIVGVAVGVTVGLGVGVAPPARLNAPILNRHGTAPVEERYSLMYQKVVSSVGSGTSAV